MTDEIEAMKREAALWAVDRVENGMTVGLGTGSTAAYAIEALGTRVANGLSLTGVATSMVARRRAQRAGISMADPEAVERIDLAIDGADQIGPEALIKGGGGAHTRERVIDTAAGMFIVVADETKVVETLDMAVPLEVMPFARAIVEEHIAALDGHVTERKSEVIDGPAFTERGNLLLDVAFGAIAEPTELSEQLNDIPGIVDHGLFVQTADTIAIGTATELEIRRR